MAVGRKAQHDADYFPFFAKDGRTLFMLQSRFGLEGIGFFTNLLRLLCTTPHHYLDLSDPMEALYTWSKIGLNDEARAVKIIELMAATGKIDRSLWTEKRVIFSQDFVDSLDELYAKRKERAMTIEQIRGIYSISAPEMPISAPELPGNANNRGINTQRKGKESKEENSPVAPKPSAEDFDPEPNPVPAVAGRGEITPLYTSLRNAFQSKNPNCWPKPDQEVQALHWLVDASQAKAYDLGVKPEECALILVTKYWELKQTGRDFWRRQPFQPTRMKSLWGDLLAEIEKAGELAVDDGSWVDQYREGA